MEQLSDEYEKPSININYDFKCSGLNWWLKILIKYSNETTSHKLWERLRENKVKPCKSLIREERRSEGTKERKEFQKTTKSIFCKGTELAVEKMASLQNI